MELWTIIIGVLFMILFLRYCLYLNGINQVRQQLKSIREAEETNQIVTNPHSLKELNQLVQEINLNLLKNRDDMIQTRIKEKALKEQMMNIFHDIRTPLASILGYFELLSDKTTTEEEQKRYLQVIQKRAQLLRILLYNYYDLAQVESDELSLQLTSVDVRAVFAEILATFYDDFSKKGIKVEVSQDVLNGKVIADKELLNRVFINLIQNILKHGQEECRIIHQNSDNQFLTQITNKVANPDPIEIDQVFNRLYSADKTRNAGNTGIGLTIAQILLKKMGHQIDAKLTEKGWFTITIHWKT